jgi:transcriptional regulator
MYVPSHFRMDDLSTIKEFMSHNEFAVVVSTQQGTLVASHLLVELQEDSQNNLFLNAHMARNNSQWKSFDTGSELLTIFQGPHTYVSPTWYTIQAVPTWNYLAVHAYGHPRIIDDRSELYELLGRLVDRHEAASGTADRFRLADCPRDFIENMMNSVVGFRISITKIEASFKLSQNRGADDYRRIIVELKRRTDESSNAVAEAMERLRPEGEAQGGYTDAR